MRCWLIVMLLSLLAWAQSPELTLGKSRFQVGDYAGALPLLQTALEKSPDDGETLFLTGMAANLSENYALGIELWNRYRKLAPEDGRGLTKLIQAHQGAGQTEQVEELIEELRGWWKADKLPKLDDGRSFVRDQFRQGEYRVMVFEFFEPDTDRREHTWDFMLLDKNNKTLAMYYVMEDTAASEIAGGKDRLFFFDRRIANQHNTLGALRRKPTYAEAKSWMQQAMSGRKIGPLIGE